MPETYDLVGAYGARDVVLVGRDASIDRATLAGTVQRVAAELPAGRAVVVACGDRVAALAAFLAAARAGVPACFPASLKDEAVRAVEDACSGVVLHDQDLPSGIDVRALLAGPPDEAGDVVRAHGERVLAVFQTSGSTGTPTTHPKTAAQLVGEADMHVARLGLGPRDRVLATVPMHHLYGFLFGALVPLRAGASIAAETPVAAHAVVGAAHARGATVLVSVPAHLRAVAALSDGSLRGRFRYVASSGAALAPGDARAVEAALLVPAEEILGSTETGGIATRRTPGGRYAPLPGVRVAVHDGRLAIASAYVDGEAAPPRITADRARLDPDGTFALLGRADDVVKVGGKRVSLADVEARIRAIPGVRDARVRAEPSTAGRGVRLAALVEADAVGAAEVRSTLARAFDDSVVPRHVSIVPSFPRTAAGKVDEATLARLLSRAPEARIAVRARPGEPGTFDVHVPASLPVFGPHFPGDPLVPGVVQLRDLVLAPVRMCFPELGALRRLSRVKFKSPLRPGADVVVVLRRPEEATIRFRILEGDAESASGMLHFD